MASTGFSRRTLLVGGACLTGGLCLCGLNGCATVTGVGRTPSIETGAYWIEEDLRLRINLTRTPQLSRVGGSVKILDAALPQNLIVAPGGSIGILNCFHRLHPSGGRGRISARPANFPVRQPRIQQIQFGWRQNRRTGQGESDALFRFHPG